MQLTSRHFLPALLLRVADATVDRVLRNVQERISELQHVTIVSGRLLEVTLVDGVETPVAHGLGRRPRFIGWSVPRQTTSGATAGRLLEITGLEQSPVDPRKCIVLKASGFTVDLQLALWVA